MGCGLVRETMVPIYEKTENSVQPSTHLCVSNTWT